MDLFELLAETRTPAQKLESAARDNDLNLLEKLLSTDVNPNLKIHKQGGNTAMHIAATHGNYLFIERLLAAGVSAEAPNDSDVTPLFMATRGNHVKAVATLLKFSLSVKGIGTLWAEGSNWTQLVWGCNNDNLIRTLIISTACLDFTRVNLQNHLFDLCHKGAFYNSLRAWLLLGNEFDRHHIDKLTDNSDPFQPNNNRELEDLAAEKEAFKNLMLGYKKTPQTLQHYCRNVVRRSFHGNCNVYNGITQLQLPDMLKQYVISPES